MAHRSLLWFERNRFDWFGLTTILIVEDDPNLRKVIRLVLERGGYATTEAPDGRSALEQIALRRPELVLADMKMPTMNGIDLIRRLKSSPRNSTVPVLILTGAADLDEARMFADAVVQKPFEPEQLLQVVVRLVGRSS